MKRVGLAGTALVLAVSTLSVIAPSAPVYAAGQTCTWTGTAADGLFSTPENWTDCNDDVPTEGDVIRFDTLLASDVSLTNDLDLDLGGVSLLAQPRIDNRSGSYKVDTLSLVAGASIVVEQASVCFPSIPHIDPDTLIGKGNLAINTSGYAQAGSTVTVNGTLSLLQGHVPYNMFSPGSSANNVTVASPVANTTATGCEGGAGGSGGAVDELANVAYNSLTIQKGALIQLMNITKPITFGGGTGANPVIWFNPNVDDTYSPVATSHTWTGAVTLLSNADVNVGSKTTVNYTGAITGSGFSLAKSVYSYGTFNFNPSSNNTSSQVGTQVNPVKTTKLEGVTNAWVQIADKETATLSGTREGISIYPGGVLKGIGTLTYGLYVNEGGVVAPGNSPGCLTSNTLSLQGEYQFELGGATACTEHDQLIVKNALNTTNAVTIDDGSAVLTTSRYNDYTPKQGDVFTIIDQSGDKPVVGTFMGLPEGATFTQNGIVFKISYVGGDGNDVTLTVQNSPTAPETGVQILKANPAVIAGATIVAAVVLLGLARRAKQQR